MRMPWSGHRGSFRGLKKRQNIRNFSNFLFARARMQWWLLGIVFFLVTAWVVFPVEYRKNLLNPGDFAIGKKSPQDVFAQVDFGYFNEIATEEEKQRTLSELPPVFTLDFQKLDNAREEFKIVRQVRSGYMLSDTQKVERMKRLFYIGPSDEVGLLLARASDEQIDLMEKGVISVLSDVLAAGVIAGGEDGSFIQELSEIAHIKARWEQVMLKLESQIDRKATDDEIAAMMQVSLVDARSEPAVERTVIVDELLVLPEAAEVIRSMAKRMPEPISAVVSEICVDLVRPNLIYDPVFTQKRLDEMLDSFTPVGQDIRKGDKIIGIGDTVTEYIKRKLEAMAAVQRRMIIRAIPGVILLTALMFYVLFLYLKRYETSTFYELRKILALGIVILLVLVLGNLLIGWGYILKVERPGFLIPSALAPVIVAILTNVQLAIVVTCIVGFFIAVMSGANLAVSVEYFLIVLASGIMAAVYSSRVRHRRHLMIAGVYVSGVNVITIIGLGLLQNLSIVKLGMNSLIGAINGIIVAILTPGLLPIFEYLSRTTTDMELLELSDLNQPLLNELKTNASGSYYHSIDVAKLAEAAAERIGANPLLARVGSYYHDIGKTSMPEYFIENQKGENIHDKLNPSMSARVIASHIKEGVAIAKQHKLPQVVIDIIQQHTGTTLIGGLHFYQKALEADKHNIVRLDDYRYPGPKPQTKEAAILLLADSVESAARAVLRDKNPTYNQIVGFVKEIVEGKITDLQLDECDITLKDINLIADAFVRVLSGMYHTRIEYPKEDTEAAPVVTAGSVKNGDNNR